MPKFQYPTPSVQPPPVWCRPRMKTSMDFSTRGSTRRASGSSSYIASASRPAPPAQTAFQFECGRQNQCGQRGSFVCSRKGTSERSRAVVTRRSRSSSESVPRSQSKAKASVALFSP